MATRTLKSNSLRTVGAIAGKDLTDSFKNREILSVLGTVIFLIAMYYYLPLLAVGGEQQRIRLFDAGGDSRVSQALDEDSAFRLYTYDSQQVMLDDLAITSYDSGELGLVVPANADQTLASGEPLVLEGYLLYWISPKKAQEIQSTVETALSQSFGQPVRVNIDGHVVSGRPDSMGRSIFAAFSLTLIFCLVGIMVAPKLILEERTTHTLDALLVSPAGYGQIVMGKALTALAISLMAGVVVVAVNSGFIVHWWLVALAAFCGSLFGVSLGLLMGILFENKQQLTLWLMILIQPVLIPMFLTIMVDIIPPGVIRAMWFIPPVALSYAVRQAMSASAPLSSWGANMALVLGVSVLLLAACGWLTSRADR